MSEILGKKMTREEKIKKATELVIEFVENWGINLDLRAKELATEIVDLCIKDKES